MGRMPDDLTRKVVARVRALLYARKRREDNAAVQVAGAGKQAEDLLFPAPGGGPARGRMTWTRAADLAMAYARLRARQARANLVAALRDDVAYAIQDALRKADAWATGWTCRATRQGFVQVRRYRNSFWSSARCAWVPGVRYRGTAWLRGGKRHQCDTRLCLTRAQATDEALRILGRKVVAASKKGR